MGKAAQRAVWVRQTHGGKHFPTDSAGFVVASAAMGADDFAHLIADGEHRVEAGHGFLENHGNAVATDGAHGFFREFKQVLAGNGPCNRERLAARNKAHREGAWVREAALAHAAKRSARRRAAA